MATIVKRIDPATLNLKEQVVAINRVTKVVKGGKNLSFSALVVIGDPQAKVVGYGVGKAKEVPSAIRKCIEAAKKNLRKVHVLETTIAHRVLGAVRVGKIGDRFVFNPTAKERKESELALVVVGTHDAVSMVEAGAKEVSE